MTTFDVFINGIQEKRLSEVAQIKQELATFLQINTEDVETLINTPSGRRIYQDVSGAEAEQHQRDLYALGVICVYRPGSGTLTLSLVKKDEDEDEDSVLLCPSCAHEITIEEGKHVPDKCPKCGVSRQRSLDIQKLDAEKEEIRKRLLQTEKSKNLRDKKNQQELEDAKRKKQLEAEIKKELNIKKDKMQLVYASGAILCGALLVTAFNYFYVSDELETAQSFDEAHSINTAQQSQQSSDQASEQGLNTTLDGQQSLQQTHDRATKVLSAFGLDNDTLTETSGSSNLGGIDAITSENQQNGPTTFSSLLLDKDSNNQFWDLFLIKEINEKIDQGKEQTAYQLSHFLNNVNNQMNTLGKLLITTRQPKIKKKIYSDIDGIINSYPINKQIQLLSQAGVQQYADDKSLDYLTQANTLIDTLSIPEQQLDAALQMGVAYFKLGDMTTANQHFGKINNLLNNVATIDKKILSRIAIAKAYKDANSDEYANRWLASAIKLTPAASNEVLSEVVAGSAYLDQLDKTLEIITNAPPKVLQDELLLNAIRVFVDTRSYNYANKLISRLKNPYYKATSEILIASHAQRYSHQLAFTETYVNKEISAPLDKAIIMSQLALQHSILANRQKTNTLYQSVKQHLNSVPTSERKDKALDIISSNFTRTLNTSYARELQASIQSPTIQANLEVEIAKTQRIASLIN